jgi:hypothetical protein
VNLLPDSEKNGHRTKVTMQFSRGKVNGNGDFTWLAVVISKWAPNTNGENAIFPYMKLNEVLSVFVPTFCD